MHATATCTSETCSLASSPYGYRPSLPANAFFLALTAVILLGSSVVVATTRRHLVFGTLFSVTATLEMISYAVRIAGWRNPWDGMLYLIGQLFSTVAPTFLSTGICLCAGEVVRILGAEHSALQPRYFARAFIPLNLLAGFLQTAGLAILRANSLAPTPFGDAGAVIVVLTGTTMQAAVLASCLVLMAAAYARAASAVRRYGYTTFHADRGYVAPPLRFRAFAVTFPLAVLFLCTRCAYRVWFYYAAYRRVAAEGIGGGDGGETLYIFFEGAMLVEALATFAIFHPGLWLDDGMRGDDARGQTESQTAQTWENGVDAGADLEQVSRLIFARQPSHYPCDHYEKQPQVEVRESTV